MTTKAAFNTDFYVVIATVIPIFYVATNLAIRLLPATPGVLKTREKLQAGLVAVGLLIAFWTEILTVNVLDNQSVLGWQHMAIGVGFLLTLVFVNLGVVFTVFTKPASEAGGG